METRKRKNKEELTVSDIIRQNLQEMNDQEFILQIPFRKEVITDAREIQT